jgi:hypothetical protein
MIWSHIISFHIILLLLPITSQTAIYDPILEQIKPGTITIIGETHKKTESVEFFKSLVLDAIKNHQCGYAVFDAKRLPESFVLNGAPAPNPGRCFALFNSLPDAPTAQNNVFCPIDYAIDSLVQKIKKWC